MNVKKTAALFLTMVAALLVFTVSASAKSDDTSDAGIAPHYELCPDCGGSIQNMGITWNNRWSPTIEIKCTHYNYGNDVIFEDYGDQEWKCSSCKRTTNIAVRRTKTECYGHNVRTSDKDVEEVYCTHYCYGTDLIAKDGTKECYGFNLN